MLLEPITKAPSAAYVAVRGSIVELVSSARVTAVHSVNALMTASYWEIGRRIVEAEQKGKRRAGYGEQLIKQLAEDLTAQFGRGFSADNLENMRRFYQSWPASLIFQTVSEKSLFALPISETVSSKLNRGSEIKISEKVSRKSLFNLSLSNIAQHFPLPWSAYVALLAVKNEQARGFYETEALRSGWSVRQLTRQIGSQFFERTALSRNKVAMLRTGAIAKPEDALTLEEVVKDPYVLEFLNLKDEYSETNLEAALVHRLEDFLLELGDDFAFIGRQKRLRIDDTWFRVDLTFYHRTLRCMVLIDLKLGKFTHADAGQMHMYLNYAKANWMREGENPPVGLILCSQKGAAQAHYALDGLPNKVMAAQYQLALPSAAVIEKELAAAIRAIESKGKAGGGV
jgi:predicted nuclease of restriction endonuclease-like (RecB) superfamily